jgi:hypothetical protein
MRWLIVIGCVVILAVIWWRLFRAVMPHRNTGEEQRPT